MHEEKKCKECSFPLTEENNCKCQPDLCCFCCKCAPDCTCGCQEKKATLKAKMDKEEE